MQIINRLLNPRIDPGGSPLMLGRSLLLIALIFSLTSVDARLDFNSRAGKKLSPDPPTVGADSKITIDGLQSSLVDTFEVGDCFVVEMQTIDDYEDEFPGFYVPFPSDSISCQFTPSATCTKMNNYQVKIQLTEGGDSVTGEFYGMKNPFSVIDMSHETIKYYEKCILTTPKDSSNQPQRMSFRNAWVPTDDVSFEVTKPIVGAFDIQNVATIKFKPATAIPEKGGKFILNFPPWYSVFDSEYTDSFGAEYNFYSFENFGGAEFSCESPNIGSGLEQGFESESDFDGTKDVFTKYYYIDFETISGSPTDEIQLICRGFTNPVTPELIGGYSVQVQDIFGNLIDRTFSFSLDASAFTPFELPASQITYTLGTPTVQKESSVQISITTSVPMTYDPAGGCFVKFTFPPELIIIEEKLKQYVGEGYFLNEFGSSITPVSWDYTSDTKFAIFPACTYNEQPSDSDQQRVLNLKFNDIILPYGKRSTSPFVTEIYKKWSKADGLSMPIATSTDSFMDMSLFEPNAIEMIEMSATNYQVQEKDTHIFEFTTTSLIPGTDIDTTMAQAIHIKFPPTLKIDPDNADAAIQIIGDGVSVTDISYLKDETLNYNPECQLEPCYIIEFSTTSTIPLGTRLRLEISNLLNPESIMIAGNVAITTMMKYESDPVFYMIDTDDQPSQFQAQRGIIVPDSIYATSIYQNFSTYSDNQVYLISFTSVHKVYKGGFIKLEIPSSFTMSSSSSAVAQFTIVDENDKNYVQINAISAEELFIVGQTIEEMEAGKVYSIKIGGLRNPRNLVDNSQLPDDQKQYFKIKTYDQEARPIDDTLNIIDYGEGGIININETSKIQSFSAESFNTSNGAETRYFISWFNQIETLPGDIVILEFPIETMLVTIDEPGSPGIKCLGLNGVTKVACEPDDGNHHILKITLQDLTQKTGLFKIQVENVRNPPSLRGSSKFNSIRHVTSEKLVCATFDQDVYIETEYASNLLGLNSSSITQTNKEYNEKATYSVTFVPSSRHTDADATPLSILLSYPPTTKPWDDSQNCKVYAYNKDGDVIVSDEKDCVKLTGSRLFKIKNAIPYGYDEKVTIEINLWNPVDNWGIIGLKIKTFEIVGDDEYLVDQLEGNELIPNLKCLAPCKECKGQDEILDLLYCDACWQNNPIKYLMQFAAYDPNDINVGNSTCLSSCPGEWVDSKGVEHYGYTSNGNKDHKCSQCDKTCATCQDNGNVGDDKLCVKCAKDYPFMFTQESRCMQSCSIGFYQLGESTCDTCSENCLDCEGDKFNCNKCDSKGGFPALFKSEVEVSGENVTRGTCRSTCPNGFFVDQTNPTDIECGKCESPCSNCEDKAKQCLSCNGNDNLFYVYRYDCFEECPEATAPDMTSLQCLDCGSNCKKCGTMEGPNCFECYPPYLLEDGECVAKCTKPGFRPNLKKTLCVDKMEFPDIGPIFSIISCIMVITVFIAKKLKKETERIPSIIALLGVIQFFAITFQVFLCAYYKNQKYLIFSLIAFLILIAINIQNAWYINTNVRAQDAQKQVRLAKNKVDRLYDESVKKQKRKAAYERAMAAYDNEGGEQEFDLDELSDIGDSVSQRYSSSSDDEQYDGGMFSPRGSVKKKLDPLILKQNHIEEKDGNYYIWVQIDDRGFMKWEDAYDRTAKAIQWIALFTSFKFYRMTYSFFMGRKQFLVLYQKKKFKKMLVVQTLFSMFFVELVIIICGVMGAANLPPGNQLYTTLLDSVVLCIFLLVMEFIEIARLDLIMRTVNTSGHQQRKAATACQSTDDEDMLSSGGSEEDDDWPDWRIMLKNVEGNRNLFDKTKIQLQLQELEKKADLKHNTGSCIEFNTGTDKEKDPRQTKSFPTSPTGYKEFNGFDFRAFGETDDNCYAESKAPGGTKNGATYSEMGTQAQPSEILTALNRKGGDLLTPNTDNDYIRRGTTKKKRGRKNKYYRQIDAEDDEEADQMSDMSDDDGLDGIKEEDEEDEEERLAKLAKIQAERDRTIAEYKAKEDAANKAKQDAENAKKLKEQQDAEAKRLKDEAEAKKKADEEAKAKAKAESDNLNEKRASGDDNQSDLSNMMVKSGALQNFSNKLDQQIVEVPPNAESRRFNECDIMGRFDRDEKGNAIVEPDANGKFFDKDGKPTNERGYLVDKDGNIINNYNGQKMFDKSVLDAKGEVPAPFNVEKHNFNPHQVRGEFDYDRNGNPMIKKTKTGEYVDKRGHRVSARGYKLDKDDNVVDHQGRVKFDKTHLEQDGDLPKFYNYNGRRFDITDIVGVVDKDENGQIIPLTDKNGNLTDNYGRRINSKGYLIDDFGNVIDKDGRQIFEKKHLYEDEVPKILPFTKFNVKNVLGDFEMDPLGNPILENVGEGNFKDRVGQRVNQKGYMIDKDGNILNKNGKTMFAKELLDNEQDIPKVFRTGLLKSDTASSLSRLMSEIGKNQPSEFDQEEQRIQEEIEKNLKKKTRNHSGNTSVDSMMEDTPANYNLQNQRFNAEMEEDEDEVDEDDEDEYGSQYDVAMGQTGFTQGGVQELAKKRRKKKKKKKKKKPVEYEDPSLREHLLAGAYGGVAKKKPKRVGVKYTTDLNAGLRDIQTPGSAFMRDASKKMMTSFSGFDQGGLGARESHRNRTNRRSEAVSDMGSNMGSRIGGKKQSKMDQSSAKLMDPQQREEYLKAKQMEEIKAKKLAAAKKRRNAPGKISKDADFEKMFGKDIDEFLEDSEWDIESIDKMSQFSKNSKNTIHSAAQAGKLRGLEKLYLQRIDTSMNKATLQQTGVISQTNPAGKPVAKKGGKFRGGEVDDEIRKPKQAWDVQSKGSRASQSVNRVFKKSTR